MKCPNCQFEFPNPISAAGGRAGGKAHVAKGFACKRVQKLAQATRKLNAMAAHIASDEWCGECGKLRMRKGQERCDYCQSAIDADERELAKCRRNRTEYK